MNYFEWFDVPQRWAIDADNLKQRYLALQREVHPDRFASADTAMQNAAQKRTLELNQAYAELTHPVRRARYLLQLAGCELQDTGTAPLPADFLMQQMQFRESVSSGDADVAELATRTAAQIDDLGQQLDNLLQQGEAEQGLDLLYQMQFLNRLLLDIDEQAFNTNEAGGV